VKQTACFLTDFYTKGVGQFQPRVELWKPCDQDGTGGPVTLKRLAVSEIPSGLEGIEELLVPGLPKLNPGLELANTFGVGFCLLLSSLVAALLCYATSVLSVPCG
jgi:hypothetical protein